MIRYLGWIAACLNSARASVLVNGSPTEEFPILRGLRQGDPMAPFLFIIAMEGLHIAIDNLVERNLFNCANINNVSVSHLFYADDVMIVGEASERNLHVITKALKFFHCVSGLKINFDKSSIIGVGLNDNQTCSLAKSVGCKVEKFPFKYLGIPIGGSTTRVSNPIVAKFHVRLSSWKANLLSIGGRSSLISSVLGSLGIYYLSLFRMPKMVNKNLEALRSRFFWGGNKETRKISWVKWGAVLASKADGGVGFGSLDSMNRALLYRWRWRGLSNPHSLWARILVAIHGENCFYKLTAKGNGIWKRIVESIKDTHANTSLDKQVIYRRIGNGQGTKFWSDIWCGDSTLAEKYPRLYALEIEKHCMVHDRRINDGWNWKWRRPLRYIREIEMLKDMVNMLPINLKYDEVDRWSWNFNGKDNFSVANLRKFFDNKLLPISANIRTKWNRLVPKKVNVFVWRLRRDCLPTSINLFAKGIDITSVNCDDGVEYTNHVFSQCNLIKSIKKLICNWTTFDIPDGSPDHILTWCDELKIPHKNRARLEGILFIWWWYIWKTRNNALHNGIKESSRDIFNSIVSLSYLWILNRDRKYLATWDSWVANPFGG